MNGYTAQVDALRSAADAARSASEQVTQVRLAEAVADAGAGMPGSRSKTSFDTVGTAWDTDIKDWTSLATQYADDLDAAAGTYRANEDAAASDFGASGGMRAK